jgi:hypothetical protein
VREALAPPAPVLGRVEHAQRRPCGAAGLVQLGVAVERVGQVGAERRVALLIVDQLGLGQRREVGQGRVVAQVERLQAAPVELILGGDQL